MTSSDPDIVRVGPVEVVPAEEEGRSPVPKVELALVGVGTALISLFLMVRALPAVFVGRERR